MKESRLSHFRKLKGISQELLAENSGISLRTIQRIETGTVMPRGHTMKTLADTLGVTLEELHDGLDESSIIIDKLRVMNFASLAGLIIPLSNVLLPFFIWRNNAHIPKVSEIGKRIIHFQILWTVVTALLLFVIPAIQFSIVGGYVVGHFPPTIVIVYVTMLICNLLLTLKTARRLENGNTNILFFVPRLF